jgi:hypothetical protein
MEEEQTVAVGALYSDLHGSSIPILYAGHASVPY